MDSVTEMSLQDEIDEVTFKLNQLNKERALLEQSVKLQSAPNLPDSKRDRARDSGFVTSDNLTKNVSFEQLGARPRQPSLQTLVSEQTRPRQYETADVKDEYYLPRLSDIDSKTVSGNTATLEREGAPLQTRNMHQNENATTVPTRQTREIVKQMTKTLAW